MNTEQVDYQMDQAPEYGVPTEVAEGIYMLRLPLPFALDHVNTWLLEDAQGWTIIDTGLGREEYLAIWDNVFDTLLASKPVKQIVLTHYHPDHVGLSGELAKRTGAKVLMSRTEWLTANMLFYDNDSILAKKMLDHFKSHGLPDELYTTMQGAGNNYRSRVSSLPNGYHRIQHGDTLTMAGTSWQCLEGQGHSPEHISLFSPERNILIAGDHILPKITPNIPMQLQDPSANPIQWYMDSLQNFKNLGQDVLVLPSHRIPFKGLDTRIDQIIDHHHQRLNLLLENCNHPVTAHDILPALFRRQLDPNQMMFAMLEALAHLVYLEHDGKLERTTANGVNFFVSSPRT